MVAGKVISSSYPNGVTPPDNYRNKFHHATAGLRRGVERGEECLPAALLEKLASNTCRAGCMEKYAQIAYNYWCERETTRCGDWLFLKRTSSTTDLSSMQWDALCSLFPGMYRHLYYALIYLFFTYLLGYIHIQIRKSTKEKIIYKPGILNLAVILYSLNLGAYEVCEKSNETDNTASDLATLCCSTCLDRCVHPCQMLSPSFSSVQPSRDF